jgi:hypothetical protein
MIFLIVALAALAALMVAPQVQARNQYLSNWQALYPASTTDNTAGRNGCQICHGSSNGVVNGYGLAIGQLLNFNQVGNASAEIAAVEGGDGDGQGDTNLTEIDANAQPGWTAGNNSMWDSGNGNAAGTQNPANIGVQPPLDPSAPPAPEPNIAVAPTTLAFGIVDTGNSNTLTTTIQNTGTAPLSVTALNLSGTSEFSLGAAPATPFNIAAGASATVDVVYTPVDNGTDSGSLNITSNDPDQATVTVNLSGTGNVPVADACNFSVAPTSLAFGGRR